MTLYEQVYLPEQMKFSLQIPFEKWLERVPQILQRKFVVEDESLEVQRNTEFRPTQSFKVEVKRYGNTEILDFDKELNDQADYIWRTRKVELNTEKTNKLTEIVLRMVGTDFPADKIRVAVLHKGRSGNAFVTPDGTICIEQSLINKLRSFDEVVAVLAHEVAHLLNGTAVRRIQADNYLREFTIGWNHEIVGDFTVEKLLERVQLNSSQVAEMLVMLGEGRDPVHLNNLTRATFTIGSHFLIDRATSHQKAQPKPDWLAGKVEPTNLELYYEAEKHKNFSKIQKIIQSLHPKDLRQVIAHVENLDNALQDRVVKLLDQRLLKLMIDEGMSASQAKVYLLLATSNLLSEKRQKQYFHNSNAILEILHDVVVFYLEDSEPKKSSVLRAVFPFELVTRGTNDFFLCLEQYLTKSKSEQKRMWIQDEEQYFSFMEQIQNFKEKLSLHETFKASIYMQRHSIHIFQISLMYEYISHNFLDESGEVKDIESLKKFLHRLSALGFYVLESELVISIDLVKKIEKPILAKIKTYIKEVFNIQEFQKTPEEIVNEFVSSYTEEEHLHQSAFEQLHASIEKLFITNKLTIDQQVQVLQLLRNALNNTKAPKQVDFLEVFDDMGSSGSYQQTSQRFSDYNSRYDFHFSTINKENGNSKAAEMNYSISKLSVVLNLAVSECGIKDPGKEGAQKKGPEYYVFLEDLFSTANIDWEKLNSVQLINILAPLLQPTEDSLVYLHSNKLLIKTKYDRRCAEDYELLCRLTPIKILQEKLKSEIVPVTMAELVQHILLKRKRLVNFDTNLQYDLFSDSMYNLIVWQREREQLQFIFSNISNLQLSEIPQIINLFELCFPNDEVVKQIAPKVAAKYLGTREVPFQERLKFLHEHLETLGVEGVLQLAETIRHISEYTELRDQLTPEVRQQVLSGNSFSEKAFLADIGSAELVRNWKQLFETMSSEKRVKISTSIAEYWIRTLFTYRSPVRYEDGKIIVSNKARPLFKTYYELVNGLRNVSIWQKQGIIVKALTEVGGALSEQGDKKAFARYATDNLSIKDKFINWCIEAAVQYGKPHLISLPLAQVFAPQLFTAIDSASVDHDLLQKILIADYREKYEKDKLFNLSDLMPQQIQMQMLSVNARELLQFGYQYKDQPSSLGAQMAQSSSELYFKVIADLKRLFPSSNEKPSDVGEMNQESKIDAIFSALQRSSALIVRKMQLTAQFFKLRPDLHARFSQAFDSNPGMSIPGFWENVYLWTEPDIGDSEERAREKAELSEYLKNITLNSKLAAGSLNTTFDAVDNRTGEEIVIRAQNPNAAFFINETHELVNTILDAVAKKTTKYRNRVRILHMLNDFSKRWCLADLGDIRYKEDDLEFRKIVSSTAGLHPNTEFYVPELRFTQSRFKTEIKGRGITANKYLQSNVPLDKKKQVIDALTFFFYHQLDPKHRIQSGTDAYNLVHSDQHLGNYLIEFVGTTLKVGVIDRNLMLRLNEADVEATNALVAKVSQQQFFHTLVDRLLTVNRVQGVFREVVKGRIYAAVLPRLIRQKLYGQENKLDLLQAIYSSVATFNLDVPLEIQLMMRNGAALQELPRLV